jgi:hypothetical protein
MHQQNRRVCLNIKGFSLLELHNGLINLKPAIA